MRVQTVVWVIVVAVSGWMLGRHSTGTTMRPEHEAPPAPRSNLVAEQPNPREVTVPTQSTGVAAFDASEASAQSPDPERLLQALVNGDDAERLAALHTALENDVEVPPERLIAAYQYDASDELRLLAFTTYIDSIATRVEFARDAMQSATANSSVAVRDEATRRLEQLVAYEAQLIK